MTTMNKPSPNKPVVLVLAGHDPSGGAGIQADIETLAAHGCIATSVITSLTAQNTQSFSYHLPQAAGDFLTQARLVVDDVNIDACKIGAIGSQELIHAIRELIADEIFPVILDPVLRSTTGHDFSNEEICCLISELLLPFTTVITPNREEALRLTGTLTPQAAADKFLKLGCKNILITDAEASEIKIINHLYQEDGQTRTFTYDRLPGNFHGSGCTLTSAISANLANNIDLPTAIEQAQAFTWNTLKHGLKLGKGQIHPNRFFKQSEIKQS
jgi:hydroxymethylpyrimidine/phosphomethylpyrimidine kinase